MTHKKEANQKHVPKDDAPVASVATPHEGFPIVGIGVSAGGLAAFEAVFAEIPTDKEPGMAFLLVQHLAPDHKSILTAWNPGAERLYGWTEAEALQLNVRDRIPPKLREEALATLTRLSQAEVLEPCDTQRFTQTGKVIAITLVSTALINEAGQMYAVATTERARPS